MISETQKKLRTRSSVVGLLALLISIVVSSSSVLAIQRDDDAIASPTITANTPADEDVGGGPESTTAPPIVDMTESAHATAEPVINDDTDTDATLPVLAMTESPDVQNEPRAGLLAIPPGCGPNVGTTNDFSGTPSAPRDLTNCTYDGENLNGANFSNTFATGVVTFDGASLICADFSGANYGSATFDGADLTGANINGANFGSVTFSAGTICPDGTTAAGTSPTGSDSFCAGHRTPGQCGSTPTATVEVTATATATETTTPTATVTDPITPTLTVTVTAVSTASPTASATATPSSSPTLEEVTTESISVTGGSPTTGTVTLSGPAPEGGSTVTLNSDNPAVSLPETAFIPEGETSIAFPISTSPVANNTPVIITATLDQTSVTTKLELLPVVLGPTATATVTQASTETDVATETAEVTQEATLENEASTATTVVNGRDQATTAKADINTLPSTGEGLTSESSRPASVPILSTMALILMLLAYFAMRRAR